jgi:GxxExxY protein
MPDRDPLTEKIIGAAIEVHRILGPGLLEAAYEECLCRELETADLPFQRQVVLPIIYKGDAIRPGFRADIIVMEQVILEIKAVERLLPIHEAQILTYLKLSGLKKGLLMNFNAMPLINGVKRFVM